MADGQLINRPAEPWWVRTSYLTAAALAAAGAGLLLTGRSSSSRAWTAYLGAYLALAAVAALTGGIARAGLARRVCRGVATGAAASFVVLGAMTIGALFAPLAAWLALSTFGGGRLEPDHDEPVVLAVVVAMLIPLLGVMTVFHW